MDSFEVFLGNTAQACDVITKDTWQLRKQYSSWKWDGWRHKSNQNTVINTFTDTNGHKVAHAFWQEFRNFDYYKVLAYASVACTSYKKCWNVVGGRSHLEIVSGRIQARSHGPCPPKNVLCPIKSWNLATGLVALAVEAYELHRQSERRGVTRGARGQQFPGPRKFSNATSTFNTVHLLPKELRFEYGGAKLASCPGRRLTPLRPWVHASLIPSHRYQTLQWNPKVTTVMKFIKHLTKFQWANNRKELNLSCNVPDASSKPTIIVTNGAILKKIYSDVTDELQTQSALHLLTRWPECQKQNAK